MEILEELKQLINILVAVILGFAIGYERKLRFKEAGIRTHTIVCAGSALMMVVSKYAFGEQEADASRVAAQIVSGIGFLGAGIIMFRGQKMHGLTTAAGIWATAGVGMAAGAGMYIVAIGSAIVIISVQCICHINCRLFRKGFFVSAVMKAKGNAGKHLATHPPLGYMKAPNDKEKWVIDEQGAETVREIFSLCIKGYGPTQIARILTERGVDTPVVYFHKHGLPTTAKIGDGSEIWDHKSVAGILENVEYTGCTVNFKSYKKSYKSKKRIKLPQEDWLVFENTQEAIIDRQTFDTVQKIRQCKRRPTPMGEMNALSGMLYCAECGKRMYLCRCTTMKQAEYFNCSSYRKALKRTCTSHQITVKAVETLLLNDLRRTLRFAQSQKEEFLRMLEENSEVKTKQEIKENLRELSAAEERIKALDKIIQSLYEDKVAGKLSEGRYLKLSETYETEQAELTEKAQTLKEEIEKDKKEKDHILDFLCLVEKYSSVEELTPEIIRSFVDRIIVHEKRKENGHYRQEVEIVYNFIGAVEIPDFLEDDEYDGLNC